MMAYRGAVNALYAGMGQLRCASFDLSAFLLGAGIPGVEPGLAGRRRQGSLQKAMTAPGAPRRTSSWRGRRKLARVLVVTAAPAPSIVVWCRRQVPVSLRVLTV